jgi:hypothetical protein
MRVSKKSFSQHAYIHAPVSDIQLTKNTRDGMLKPWVQAFYFLLH